MRIFEFRVSVIIPVYNASQFLLKAVESALQLNEVGEVILVEDGSKDESFALCKQLTMLDNRVILVQHEGGVNRGAGASRNLGILKATCPFIAFLDSDDYYFENRFVRAKEIFECNANVAGVYEPVLMINEITGSRKVVEIEKGIESKDLFRQILRGAYFHTNSITVKREFLLQMGPFNQQCWPHEDVEMWLRIAYFGTLVNGGDQQIASYRVHGANNMLNANRKSRMRLWNTVIRFWFFKNIGLRNRLIILKQVFRWF